MVTQGCNYSRHSQRCVELQWLSDKRIAQYARRGFQEYLSFCFTFVFHLSFLLIQLKVTKSYEIAGRGSPES